MSKKQATHKQDNRRVLTVAREPNESHEKATARTSLKPSIQNALTLQQYNKSLFPDLSLDALVVSLSDQCKAIADGDMGRAEAMLTAQAHTLDAIFNNLSRRAIHAEYMDNLDRYLRLGLKAQAQCARTLEVLAAMKNPAPVAFVRQANIGQAVQVNNGPPPAASPYPSRAGETENQQNKLLELKQHERMDFGATQAAIKGDLSLEAVGEIDRPANPSG